MGGNHNNDDNIPDDHFLIGRLELHLKKRGLENEIEADRLKEIIDGYKDLIVATSDQKVFDSTDTRTVIKDMNSRERVLYLAPAEKGSYSQELRMYDDSPQKEMQKLPFEEQTGFGPTIAVLEALMNGEHEEFKALVAAPAAVSKAVEGAKKILPRGDESFTFVVNGEEKSQPKLSELDLDSFLYHSDEYMPGQIMARICSIDFDKKQIGLKACGQKKKHFSSSYKKDNEEQLIQWRELVLIVKAHIQYDAQGEIADVSDARIVGPVSLEPFEISFFEANNKLVKLTNPLVIVPIIDEETEQLFIAEHSDLDMFVYSESLDGLKIEVLNYLQWCYSEIAGEDDDSLVPSARRVKDTLLSMVVE